MVELRSPKPSVGGSSPSTRAIFFYHNGFRETPERQKNNYMKDKIINFFLDIYKEMKKVTWPKKKELVDFTKIVLVTMLIFAVIVYLIDQGISKLLGLLF